MTPVFSIPENFQKLWVAWNVRGFIIVSFSLQAFLLLLAPLRQRIRSWGKWVIWGPYLLADWVALSTIGLIVQSNSSTTDGPSSDIMAFWAPFLLLHLGGPDSITSYSLEDNKLWQRHLFGLARQLIFTTYILLKSFSRYELLVATLLVLFAGVVKYVERNVALYRASLDHFGEKWQVPNDSTAGDQLRIPIPVQFKGVKNNLLHTAVLLLGSLKGIIIGPAPKKEEQDIITHTFCLGKRRSCDAFQIIEIELSLLYELLHTKLPVIASTAGFIFRMASFSCILVALISFTLVKKYYQLGLVDILLTYWLLMGALVLDLLSIISLTKSSDWFAIARLQDQCELPDAFINRRRWCKQVSQLNFFTYHVKDYPVWLKKLDEDCMWSLLENININFRCPYSRNFQDPLWRFIWKESLKKYDWRKSSKKGKKKSDSGNEDSNEQEAWLSKEEFKYLLIREKQGKLINEKWEKLIDEFIFRLDNFSQALLVWHLGTELYFQDDNDQYRRESGETDYRSICKLLSDYMFYLAVGMQPSMMAAVLDDWKEEFESICDKTRKLVPWSFFSNEETACKTIFKIEFKKKEWKKTFCFDQKNGKREKSSLCIAVELAHGLKNLQGVYDNPWKFMSKVWVHLMFFAAVTCSPYVHAQQPSKGGELLTFVWLSLNHLGLGIEYKTLRELFNHPPMGAICKAPVEEEDGQESGRKKAFTEEDCY